MESEELSDNEEKMQEAMEKNSESIGQLTQMMRQ